MKKFAFVIVGLACAFGAPAIEVDDAVWAQTTNRVTVLWEKHEAAERFRAEVQKKREAHKKEIEEKKRQREQVRNLGKKNNWNIKPKGAAK